MNNLFELIKANDSSFAEWEYVKELGRGRFGVVYQIEKTAGHSMKNQTSAVKIIEFGTETAEMRDNTINVMNLLRNENHVVGVEDYSRVTVDKGTDNETEYLAIRMELLQTLPQDGMEENEVIRLAAEMCDILMTCHGGSPAIYHCDIKPENIFVASDGAYKLGDFGEAQFSKKGRAAVSEIGTDGYRAPELYNGKKYDNRCDLYSLGVTLYTLLNGGKLPFGDIDAAVVNQQKGKRFPRIKGIHRDFMRVIWRLCARKPSARFESARELMAALMPIVARRSKEIQKCERNKKKTQHITNKIKSEIIETSYYSGDMNETVPLSPEDEIKYQIESDCMAETVKNISSTGSEVSEHSRQFVYHSSASVIDEDSTLTKRSLLDTYSEMKRSSFSQYYIPFHVKRMTACIIAAILLSVGLYYTTIRPNYAVVEGRFIILTTDSLDLSDMGMNNVSDLARCKGLRQLDLTGNDISIQEYEHLHKELPNCHIIWDVPVGNTKFRSDVKTITALEMGSENESYIRSAIQYFPELSLLDMTGSSLSNDYLIDLRENASAYEVVWTISIEETEYSTDCDVVTLELFDADTAALLRCFNKLQRVEITGDDYSDDELAALRDKYPEYNLVWYITIRGEKLRTDTPSIELRHLANTEGAAEDVKKLKYFSSLVTLDLFYSKLEDYSFLVDCQKLERLNISLVDITDFSVLKNLRNIKELILSWNTIDDLSFLTSMPNLQILELYACTIRVGDEKHLIGHDELWYLNISGSDLVLYMDYSLLKVLPSLTVLLARDDALLQGTYNGLRELTTLKVFQGELNPNNLIYALGNCKDLEIFSCGALASNFYLADFSVFPKLKSLNVYNLRDDTRENPYISNFEVVVYSSISNSCKTEIQKAAPNCELISTDKWYMPYLVNYLSEYYLREYFEGNAFISTEYSEQVQIVT